MYIFEKNIKMNFKEHIRTFLSEKEANDLEKALFSDNESHCLRFNTLKVNNIDEYIKQSSGVIKHPHVLNAFIYDKEIYEFGKSILFDAGAYYIQDGAAMMATHILNIKENDYVLDMCAAPGGKTFNALLALNNTGLLICNDIHDIRSNILSSNVEKYGFANCIVLNDDSANYYKYLINFFDKIILDAPCSGSAMFRKNSMSYEQWSIEKVMCLKKIQLSLLEDAYKMLKPNGEILYSTCSFSPQENEEVIIDFLNKHNDMKIVDIPLNKIYDDTIKITGGLRLYPNKFPGEGQCMFLLKKDCNDLTLKNKVKEIQSTKIPQTVASFLNNYFSYDKKDIIKFKNNYCYAPFIKIDLNNVKIKRYGLELVEVKK
ncbi:MAG: RsmB/NOP family class I SAM-dependent RNA methyltransferase, partial [Erysipelotrichaceae bacterium]|nr:RsmB/NOP family class I SAM-dependent RNA methyltransferase [Erysipelotrichaceae bacterium]